MEASAMTNRATEKPEKIQPFDQPWALKRHEIAGLTAMSRADPTFDGSVPHVAPRDPALRVKWIEAIGGHPRAVRDACLAAARGEEGTYDGDRWWPDATPETLRIVAEGSDHEEADAPEENPDPAPDSADADPDPADVDFENCLVDDDVLPPLPESLRAGALRTKWEMFARLYAYGHSAADAARHAGYAWHRAPQSGWRLLQDERVKARVRELTDHLYGAEPWDKKSFVTRLEAVYREAMNRGQYMAAVRAVEAAAKIELAHIARTPRLAVNAQTEPGNCSSETEKGQSSGDDHNSPK